MTRLRIVQQHPGMYSEERIAEIKTVDGIEEVPVHVSKIAGQG